MYCFKLGQETDKRKKMDEEMFCLRKKIQLLDIEILHKDREIKKFSAELPIDKREDSFIILDKANTYAVTIKSKLALSLKPFRTSRALDELINYLQEQN